MSASQLTTAGASKICRNFQAPSFWEKIFEVLTPVLNIWQTHSLDLLDKYRVKPAQASCNGNILVIQALLARGEDIHAKAAPLPGRITFQAAADSGHLDAVGLILIPLNGKSIVDRMAESFRNISPTTTPALETPPKLTGRRASWRLPWLHCSGGREWTC